MGVVFISELALRLSHSLSLLRFNGFYSCKLKTFFGGHKSKTITKGMYDLGDELTIDSYRIPWLIWIQLLVLFLLIFLLFCFSFSTSDPPKAITPSSPSSSSPSTSGIFTSHDPGLDKSVYKHTNSTSTAATKRCLHPQGGEDQSIKGERATNIGRRIVREDLGLSSKDTSFIDSHPCNYFRLAKLAFLKCFGLDNLPENSSSSDRRKDR